MFQMGSYGVNLGQLGSICINTDYLKLLGVILRSILFSYESQMYFCFFLILLVTFDVVFYDARN